MPAPVSHSSTTEPACLSSRSRQPIITSIICLAPSLLVLLSAFVPLVRATDENDLDWLPLINEAHAHALAWGRDIVFTYGPFGYLWSGYDPRTFGQLCVFWTISAAITWGIMWRLVRKQFGRSVLTAGLVLWVMSLALGGDYTCSPDMRLMMLPLLLLLDHFFVPAKSPDPLNLALVALIAFTGLIKFPYLVAGGATVLLICLDPLHPLRHRSLTLSLYGLTFIAGWLIAGQGIANLPDHLRWSMELTRGYTEALSISPTVGQSQTVPYLAITALLVALSSVVAVPQLRRRSVLFLVGMLMLLFIAFRSGFVRHDIHEVIATGITLNTILLAGIALWRGIRGWPVRIAWTICLAGALILESKTVQDWHGDSLPQELSRTLTGVVIEAAETVRLLGGNPSSNYLQWRRNTAAIVAHVPLPPVRGSVDLYPKDATILLAHGLDYRPRPTLQSYVAYTPALATLNAARLSAADAPDNILFRIDFRTHDLPSGLDNFSWLQILCRYQLADSAGDYMRLVKRAVPFKATLTPLIDSSMPMGAAAHLQWNARQVAPTMVWAKVTLERTALGTLMSHLYKSPLLVLTIRTMNGQGCFARIVPDSASAGFLLGPVVIDNAAFAMITAPNPDPATWQSMMPESIMLSGVGGTDISWYFKPTAHVSLYGLTLENR